MDTGTYQFKSDFAKKYIAKGLEVGRAKGLAEGKAEGKAEAVLKMLEIRKLPTTQNEKDKILACQDGTTLDL